MHPSTEQPRRGRGAGAARRSIVVVVVSLLRCCAAVCARDQECARAPSAQRDGGYSFSFIRMDRQCEVARLPRSWKKLRANPRKAANDAHLDPPLILWVPDPRNYP